MTGSVISVAIFCSSRLANACCATCPRAGLPRGWAATNSPCSCAARRRPGPINLACTLLAALREPFMVAGKPACVGASVGLARATGATLPDALLGQADQALYAAKRSGKNRFCWFEESVAEDEPVLRVLRA